MRTLKSSRHAPVAGACNLTSPATFTAVRLLSRIRSTPISNAMPAAPRCPGVPPARARPAPDEAETANNGEADAHA